MRERRCDACQQPIPSREAYLKVSMQSWDGSVIRQEHAGDLCQECWQELMAKDVETQDDHVVHCDGVIDK